MPGTLYPSRTAVFFPHAAVFVAGAVLTIITSQLIGRCKASRRRKRIRDFITLQQNKEVTGDARPVATNAEDVLNEQLSRTKSFLGADKMERLEGCFVIVVGCGGVGSHAANMLLRSGVRHLRLIDFDQLTLSSLNRHSLGLLSDVGLPKVEVLARKFREINPLARVDPVRKLFCREDAEHLLDGNPDLVLDCIDNLDTKVDLLELCVNKGLKVISSMGAGAKLDASQVVLTDISDTSYDPLARSIRKVLRLRGISTGIPVVSSTEIPLVSLTPLNEKQMQDPSCYATLPSFRVRILPVMGMLPAVFGMVMASWAVSQLCRITISGECVGAGRGRGRIRQSLYDRMHFQLCNTNRDVYKDSRVLISSSDVAFILEETFNGCSAISGDRTKPTLVRWDREKPSTFGNLVIMTKAEAKRHESLGYQNLETAYGRRVVDWVERRLREEVEWLKTWGHVTPGLWMQAAQAC